MRTYEKGQEELGSELEIEAPSKIYSDAEAVNSEERRLFEHSRHSYIGDIKK